MPQKTETISVTGYDEERIMLLAYGALKSLDWTIKYAVGNQIIAYTPRSWSKYDHGIDVEVKGEDLTVTSRHIHGELADLPGRNKKHLVQFFAAFESVKANATEEQLNTWRENISSLHVETLSAAAEEIKQSEEVDKVMNLSKSNLYATYAIMAINAIVFVMMLASGVSFITPTGIDIINWGGNFSPLTLSGDWWRLVSCVFVHIGIIHLLFNMYALYMIGIYLEPMLGKARFIAAYFATGIGASLVSLWWHDEPIASAGASGAIFGMYGVFLALLSTKLIPKQVRGPLLQSISVFIVFNLIYGMKSGIDNAAHVGGLLSGLIIGYIFHLGWKGETFITKKFSISMIVLAAAIAATFFYLEKNKVSAAERWQFTRYLNTGKELIEEEKEKSNEELNNKLAEFEKIKERAIASYLDPGLTKEQQLKNIDSIAIPEWTKADQLMGIPETGKLSRTEAAKAQLCMSYIRYRLEECEMIKQLTKEDNLENRMELTRIQTNIKLAEAEIEKL